MGEKFLLLGFCGGAMLLVSALVAGATACCVVCCGDPKFELLTPKLE
jgi:hypothetical protein